MVVTKGDQDRFKMNRNRDHLLTLSSVIFNTFVRYKEETQLLVMKRMLGFCKELGMQTSMLFVLKRLKRWRLSEAIMDLIPSLLP